MKLAAEGRNAIDAVKLAVTVASPTEKRAPVIGKVLSHFYDLAADAVSSQDVWAVSSQDVRAAEKLANMFATSNQGE